MTVNIKPRRNIHMIVAVCDDWGIGADGGMVVANRADMRHFVQKTTGHTVLMGRRTLESFPGGRALKNRRNVVLTRDPLFVRAGVEPVRTLEEALTTVACDDEVWIIGGGRVYEELLPYASECVVTKNHCLRNSDTFFPNLDEDPEWEVVATTDTQEIAEDEGDAGVRFESVTYRRLPA